MRRWLTQVRGGLPSPVPTSDRSGSLVGSVGRPRAASPSPARGLAALTPMNGQPPGDALQTVPPALPSHPRPLPRTPSAASLATMVPPSRSSRAGSMSGGQPPDLRSFSRRFVADLHEALARGHADEVQAVLNDLPPEQLHGLLPVLQAQIDEMERMGAPARTQAAAQPMLPYSALPEEHLSAEERASAQCPITLRELDDVVDPIEQPVAVRIGRAVHVFEYSELQTWLAQKSSNPINRGALTPGALRRVAPAELPPA